MKYLSLILILLVASILFSINLNKPFIGHHDFNSALFSSIGRNLTRYSLVDTKLGQLTGDGPQQPQGFSFYTHNVPLLSWFIALNFKLFQVGEWQARIISIVASIISVLLIYLIAQRLISKVAGPLAALFFSLSAMMIYFSSNVFPEPLAISLSLGTFYCYLIWSNNNRLNYYRALLVFGVLSQLTVWGSYFLIPYLVAHHLLFKKRNKLRIIIFATIPFLIFLFFILHVFILTGSPLGGGLTSAFLFRLGGADSSLYGLNPNEFFLKEFSLNRAYYSNSTVFLVLLWSSAFLIKAIKKTLRSPDFLIAILGLWGLTYILIFRNAAAIHDYFLIYLAPFIALSSASILSSFYSSFRNSKIKNPLLLIVIFAFPLLGFLQIKNFAKALVESDGNRDGYYLGISLKSQTAPKNNILVLSAQFGSHFSVFTNFYADRKIVYRDYSLDELINFQIQNYDFIVFIEGRDTSKDVDNYLASHYDLTKTGIFHIYNIAKSK